MISSIIGYPISRHYPIVGDFAFNHSSGIHQDGVIKFRETYEIIKPESVGWEGTRMRLVSQSGKAGVAKYITELGYDGSDLISDVMPRFKALSSMKKEMSDDDLHMIVREVLREREADEEKYFCIDNESIAYSAIFGKSTATAEVVIRKNGQSERGCSAGDGPIDAVCKAINKALSEFKIAIRELCLDRWLPVQGSGGAESNAWIIVHISLGEKKGYGRSADPDTVKATAKAYLDAINHALASDIQFSSED